MRLVLFLLSILLELDVAFELYPLAFFRHRPHCFAPALSIRVPVPNDWVFLNRTGDSLGATGFKRGTTFFLFFFFWFFFVCSVYAHLFLYGSNVFLFFVRVSVYLRMDSTSTPTVFEEILEPPSMCSLGLDVSDDDKDGRKTR